MSARRPVGLTRRTGAPRHAPRLGRIITPRQAILDRIDAGPAVDRAMRDLHINNPDAWHAGRPRVAARDDCPTCVYIEADTLLRMQRQIAETTRQVIEATRANGVDVNVDLVDERIRDLLRQVDEVTATPSWKPGPATEG